MTGRWLRLVFVCSLFVLAAACAKATSPTGPTLATNASVPPVLTLIADTASPVGQSAAITYGSRAQQPGRIVVAVTGYNLQNQIGSNVGVGSTIGRLKWDGSLLEVDRSADDGFLGADPGDFFGDRTQTTCCRREPDGPGFYPFSVSANSTLKTGSGELILIRLKPLPGVTSGTTRIELESYVFSNFGYTTPIPLLLAPYVPFRGNVMDNVYGATITIRPGR